MTLDEDVPPFGDPIDVTSLFRPERAALIAVLAGLDDAGWNRPTACPGWSVRDVAAHVLGDDLGRLARTRDASTSLAPRDGEGLVGFIDRLNDEWVTAARRLSPALIVDLLAHTGQQVAALWASLDPQAASEPVIWAGDGVAPVWLDAARDYTEYWIHQQQIRDAVGNPGLQEARFLAPVLDTLLRALPWTLRHRPDAVGTSLTFIVEGEGGGSWTVVRHPQGWRLGARGATTAATVTLDADTTWRLCSRVLTPGQARAAARLDGEEDLAEEALQIVSVIHPDLVVPTSARGEGRSRAPNRR